MQCKIPSLEYISDTDLFSCVDKLLTRANQAQQEARRKFNRNIIDPFSPLFEMAGFNVHHQDWEKSELTRQSQKSVSNNIGLFHQSILGSIDGWEDLGTGSQIDLVNASKGIIAEVKNKHNTVKESDLHNIYQELDDLVSRKASAYKGYTSYYVTIIPKRPERYNKEFTPSNKEKGMPCARNERIRTIDGASFYHLATGFETALIDLFRILPDVIEHRAEALSLPFDKFSTDDKKALETYFNLAYLPKNES